MKVLTIVNGLGLGGTERAAQNFSVGYRNAGWDVKVLGLNGLGHRAVMLQKEGITVYDGSVERENVLGELKNWNPDIIHIHRAGFANAEMMHIVKALKNDQNRVLETNVFARPDYSPDAALIDVHLQLSNWCLWKWKNWTSIIRPKPLGAVVPYPVNTQAILDIKAKTTSKRIAGIPENAFIIGRVGQPFFSKWDEVIFEVLQELLVTDQSFYLLLIGLPGELKIALAKYPQLVQDHVVLLPTTNSEEELGALYKTFHCFLHAAKIGESFGMVLAEALLYECPVITLSTPLKDNSQLEVVGHERGGLVVADKKAMVKAIRLLKANEPLRKQYGQNGCKYVSEHFNLETITDAAIHIAKLALSSENREQLKQQLVLSNTGQTVTTKDIMATGKNISGKLSLSTRIKMRLVHQPFIYRMFLKLKKTGE